MKNDREDKNEHRLTTFYFDGEKKNSDIFCFEFFFNFETKSGLSTSIFIFSTISQILEWKF